MAKSLQPQKPQTQQSRGAAGKAAGATAPKKPSTAAAPAAAHLSSLQSMFEVKLQESKFRLLNEKMYSMSGAEAQDMYRRDPQLFADYHRGYRIAIQDWPIDPANEIIAFLNQKRNKGKTVADMGCGEAKLASGVREGHLGKMWSFDLVAANEHVTSCDIAHTPLDDETVDIVVFCLSLMGTNYLDFLVEAHRVLRAGGVVVVAEPDSRIVSKLKFAEVMDKMGFSLQSEAKPNGYFRIFYFGKTRQETRKPSVATDKLFKPWLYKKRGGSGGGNGDDSDDSK